MKRPSSHLSRQQGSVLVNVAAGLFLMITLLASIDLGMLYYYKREYQKAADLAALAGSRQMPLGCTAAEAAGIDSANINLAKHTHDTPVVQCGIWEPAATPRFVVSSDDDANAVRALILGSIPTLFLGNRNLSAEAVATGLEPIAQLTIRSEAVSLNDGILNSVTGALLGGALNLSVASWEGLLGTNINLLSYLDALALDLGIGAGKYDQVLGTNVTVGQLLDVAADVLDQGGGTGDSSTVNAAIGALGQLVGANLPGLSPLIQLGDLLNIATGTPAAGLDTTLNVFQLVQGGIQLANGSNVVSANLPVVGIPGVATTQVKLKVIEAPQLSAIGHPGKDDISVRTAQVRTLLTVNLSGISNLVNNLTAALTPLLSPIIDFLDSAGYGGLNLLGAVGNLLEALLSSLGAALFGCNNNCASANQVYAEGLGQPLQISLDAAGAKAAVTNYDCSAGKSLDVEADTSVAYLRIGAMNEADVFSATTPVVDPISLVEIGYRKVRPRTCGPLGIGGCQDLQWEQPNGSWLTDGKASAKRYVISGLGLKVDTPIGGSSTQFLDYVSPTLPDVGQEPEYQAISSSGVVNSLSATISGAEIRPYQATGGGVLGTLLNGTLSLLNGVLSAVRGLVDDVLAGLLDPILDSLVGLLGVDLAAADVGANLSCEGGGGTLVE